MEIVFNGNKTLPQLAWCARVRPGDSFVEVEHGSAVETFADFFHEGAWSGGFSAEGYLAASVVAGTGGAVYGGGFHFVPSSDRLCPLFNVTNASGTHISNSPVFALASAKEHLDPVYPFYFHDFLRCWRMGLHGSGGRLRLLSGRHLNVHFFKKIILEERGKISCRPHSAGPKPWNYQSYRSILMDGVAGLFSNAADERRKRLFRPLVGLSKGYDSTAVACLAAQAGCGEAYTLVDGGREDRECDNGKTNAALLGMECAEYDRWEHKTMPGLNSAEFAMLGVAVPLPLAVLGEKLQGRLLVMGDYGDIIWSPEANGHCEELTIPWSRILSGVGHAEFRLRTGFHVVAPACIAARHSPEIHRITHSGEMRPWWVEGTYNRPLPRRIAEETGIPRGQFGLRKYARGHSTYRGGRGFNAEGHQSYLDYVKSSKEACGGLKWKYWKIHDKLFSFLWKHFSSDELRYRKHAWWRRYVPFLFGTRPNEISWTYRFTFQWSAEVLRDRYRQGTARGLSPEA